MLNENCELSELIECPIEDFESFCEDKDLGYMSNLCILLNTLFQNLTEAKDFVKNQIIKEKVERPHELFDKLDGYYVVLMKVEAKACRCKQLIEARKMDI